MLRTTHVWGALALGGGTAVVWGMGPVQAASLTGASALAAGWPDTDRLVDDGPGHRSLTHSLSTGGVVGVLALAYVGPGARSLGTPLGEAFSVLPLLGGGAGAALGSWVAALLVAAVAGLAVGYLSHLLLDAMTKAGVWVFLPGGPRVRFVVVSDVGNTTEQLIRTLLKVVFILGALAVAGRLFVDLSDLLAGQSAATLALDAALAPAVAPTLTSVPDTGVFG